MSTVSDYPTRKWYCQACSTVIVRAELENIACPKCDGKRWSLQPKLHSFTRWELTEADRIFLQVQGIDPYDFRKPK